MIYLTTIHRLKNGAGASGGFLIDAKDSFQAWSVAVFFTHKVLGLPAETKTEITPVAASQDAVPCEIVRTMAHSMPPSRSSRVTGVLKAQAAAVSFDPLCLGVKINAMLPQARIELPMALPLVEACNVCYVDTAGLIRELGHIDTIDFDLDLTTPTMASMQSRAAHPQFVLA